MGQEDPVQKCGRGPFSCLGSQQTLLCSLSKVS